MNKWLECVPNFSEGRNRNIINKITASIQQTELVRLLNVDPGQETNRTVVTFAGPPEAVIEAAFRAIKSAAENIDMLKHSGKHPRMGATDVCPLIPISGMTMEEVVDWSRKLAKRVGEELSIPVFLYENSATSPIRKNLANIRSGEYEGLAKKLKDPQWKPDFGPSEFKPKSGATAIGARDYLVAYNINLNTQSTRRANAVAFDVRENGRIKREGNSLAGKIVRDEKGNPVRIPGTCRFVKAIGWYIEEYGLAQVSMNLTNLNKTPLHKAFQACCDSALSRGLRVTGSELVGLVPKKVLVDTGIYFLKKQKRSIGIPEKDIIRIAVKSLGLDELKPFDPSERIIEYLLEDGREDSLQKRDLVSFSDLVASESPVPGGGSVAAMTGALAASLATMVANVSANKRGWDDRWEEFSNVAERGQSLKTQLLSLVDADAFAFQQVLAAMRMSKKTEEDKKIRDAEILAATKRAIEVPFQIMKTTFEIYEILEEMVRTGLPSSITDAGAGAYCAHAAISAAFLNIEINCKDFNDREYADTVLKKAGEILDESKFQEAEIIELVKKKIVD